MRVHVGVIICIFKEQPGKMAMIVTHNEQLMKTFHQAQMKIYKNPL